ncbi:MAG: tetratricopeptide repeat protein [Planctomycetota bacterium]
MIRTDLVDAVAGGQLAGCELAVCGRLLSLSRTEVQRRVRALGGRLVAVPRATTKFVVVTDRGEEPTTAGARRAARLRAAGCPIEVLDERDLLQMLGLGVDLGRLFSADQLAAAVDVPPRVVRGWTRHGLLEATRSIRRLHLFDFRQLACARDLAALRHDGVKPARLRRALRQMARWHPDADSLATSLASLVRGDDLLVRLADGRLAEPSGQLRLQFDATAVRPKRALPRFAIDPLAAFEAALAHEEHGEYEAAQHDYEVALEGFGREPEILFNLGNVHFALGRRADAAAFFLEAVQVDPTFAEAWNNLGNALADVGRAQHAVLAYRQALSLQPDYADVHFNLAEVLHEVGAIEAARRHWQAYLRRDPFSRWARRARARLDGRDE